MQTSDGGRYGGSTSNAYSPNLRRPGGGSQKRTALKVALCLLLPPVGLFVDLAHRVRLRCAAACLTSALACASLCLMCLPLFEPASAPTVLPQAGCARGCHPRPAGGTTHHGTFQH